MKISTPARAIGSMLIAICCFSFMDVCIKLLSETYPPLQITWLRASCSIPFLLMCLPLFGGLSQLKTSHIGQHLIRGIISILTLVSVVYCLSKLPLADSYAIFFTAPLFITLLSIPILKEKVGMHRGLAVIVGFIGVLVMVKPQSNGLLSLAAGVGIFAAFCFALTVVHMKKLSNTESTAALTFYFLLFVAVGAGLLALPNWVAINWQQWPIFLVLGISGTLGQVFMTTAFRLAPAAVVAPFEYTAMIWAVILGYWFWGDIPELRLYIGASIVVACGLYILYRETRLSSQPIQKKHA